MRKNIWLLVNNIQVTISVTLQYFTWQMKGQATSSSFDENLTCEFKRKNSFTLSKSCMKTERFLYCLWKAVFIHILIQEPDQKAKENFPVVFFGSRLSKLFFEWLKKTLCLVQVYLREETLRPEQVALTKMPRNEAKIYQETDFFSTEGHLLTSSGCFVTVRLRTSKGITDL